MEKASETALRVIIAGAPASGKGSQAAEIVKRHNLVHLSTGDILRKAAADGTVVGDKATAFMNRGELVPDALMCSIVQSRIQQKDCLTKGWLLDGYPRTKFQADYLAKNGILADVFLLLQVPEEVLVDRIVGRRLDPVTNKIYHVEFNPPPTEEIRKRCTVRADDTEEKVKVRIEAFRANINQVKMCYADVEKIVKADGDKEDVTKEILAYLNGQANLKAEKVRLKNSVMAVFRHLFTIAMRFGGVFAMYGGLHYVFVRYLLGLGNPFDSDNTMGSAMFTLNFILCLPCTLCMMYGCMAGYVDYFLVKPVARGVVLVAGDRAGSFTERVLATGSSVVADGGEESEEEEAEGENKV